MSWGKPEQAPPKQIKIKSDQQDKVEKERCPKIKQISANSVNPVQQTYHSGNRSDVYQSMYYSNSAPEMRVGFAPEARAQPMPALSTARDHLGKVIPVDEHQINQLLMHRRESQVPKGLLKYPVQPLQETLTRYLESLQPLVSDQVMEKEEDLAVDFLRNQGYELQSLLLEAAASNDNWLTDRWTDVCYLRYRAPLTIFSSSCIAFPKQNFRNSLAYLDFTARAIHAMCQFYWLVENNNLPVRKMEGYDLDNSQFHNVFGTVRIPQHSYDYLQQCKSNYIVVIHKNNVRLSRICVLNDN